jgi:hypothetical protein
MVLVVIRKNFPDMGLFKTLCEDAGGRVSGNKITFQGHQDFAGILKLIPAFLPKHMRKYLDFKEITE